MIAAKSFIFRFASVEVREREFSIIKLGEVIPVEPKAFRVLLFLLRNPQKLITKDELLDAVWGETAVSENSLARSIALLRRLLGDDIHQPRYIETIATVGYRFVCKVEASEDSSGDSESSGLPKVVASPLGLRDRIMREVAPLPKIESIAVLPFDSLSQDADQEYFADGMTDALLTDLGRIRTLRVISRRSIMRYKGSKTPLPEIARELNVDAIVEGTVQRAGDKVRITAQLLQARTDRDLWAESYERDFRDVLSLQGRMARDIVRGIEVTLSPDEASRLTATRMVNPDAYEAYLKGNFQYYSISNRGQDKAERYYQVALEKDPNCALAYAGLAAVWISRSDSGHALPSEALPRATSYLLKALQLEPDLSEVHVSLANLDFMFKRDWVSAEKEFQRGIELNPSSQDAHMYYADYLVYIKRYEEWRTEIQRALAIDPMSSFTRTFYGWQLVYLGRCDEAIEELQKALASQPDFSSAYMGLWGAYYKKHMDAQAIQEAVRFYQVIDDQEAASAINAGYQQAGYKEGMRRAAEILALRSKQKYVPGIRIARLYAHAGDTNRAILWLQKADQARETALCRLGVGWDWDALRSDPRFQEIIMHMNFPAPRQ